jgi:hypothetical protein
MDKRLLIAAFVAAVVLVGITGVNIMKTKESPKITTAPETTQPQEPMLKEEQVVACDAADRANTCQTKLPKLVGLVTMEDCCKHLGKCCQ